MRIGILGTGSVGGTLGVAWSGRGHEVVFGSRSPRADKVQRLLRRCGEGAGAVSPAEAAELGEVVVLAVPWESVHLVLREIGDLPGKTVLDCTNPLTDDLSGLVVGPGSSGAETIASSLTNARIVKIFNSTGAEIMADPSYPEGPATMLYCGDNGAAKEVAADLAADLGFEPVDLGSLRQARLLEEMALLWLHLAIFQKRGRRIAFRLMDREE